MQQNHDLEKLSQALCDAWQTQVQKIISDPIVTQATQNYMEFLNSFNPASSENSNHGAQNPSPFQATRPAAASASAHDGSRTADLLAARLEESERRISLLEAVVHGLLRQN